MKLLSLVLLGLLGFLPLANAAIPPDASMAIGVLGSDSASMVYKIFDVVIPVTSGFVILKLFKRAANKA